jgi:predicted RNase H-like HicB family nuclease
MMQYLVVIEQGDTGFGAYVPDLPGCIAAAETREEVLELIQEAIDFHIEDLRERGAPVPAPLSSGQIVQVGSA